MGLKTRLFRVVTLSKSGNVTSVFVNDNEMFQRIKLGTSQGNCSFGYMESKTRFFHAVITSKIGHITIRFVNENEMLPNLKVVTSHQNCCFGHISGRASIFTQFQFTAPILERYALAAIFERFLRCLCGIAIFYKLV